MTQATAQLESNGMILLHRFFGMPYLSRAASEQCESLHSAQLLRLVNRGRRSFKARLYNHLIDGLGD